MEFLEIGKKYRIIYDDKGRNPVEKNGLIVGIQQNLIILDSGEELNLLYVIRAIPVEGGIDGKSGKH